MSYPVRKGLKDVPSSPARAGLTNGVFDGALSKPAIQAATPVLVVLVVLVWGSAFFWALPLTAWIPQVLVRWLVHIIMWIFIGGLLVNAFEALHFAKAFVSPLKSRTVTFFYGEYVKTIGGRVPHLLSVGANGVQIAHWGTVMVSVSPQEYGFVSSNNVELESALLEIPIHPVRAEVIAVRAMSKDNSEGTERWEWLEDVDFQAYAEKFIRPVLVKVAGAALRKYKDSTISTETAFEKFRQNVLEGVRNYPIEDASIFKDFPGLERYATLELWLDSFGVGISGAPVGFVDVDKHSPRHESRQRVAQACDDAEVVKIKAGADAEAIKTKAGADAKAIGMRGDAKAEVDRQYLKQMGINLDADENVSPELMRIAAAATDEGGVTVSDSTERKEIRIDVSNPKTAELFLAALEYLKPKEKTNSKDDS